MAELQRRGGDLGRHPRLARRQNHPTAPEIRSRWRLLDPTTQATLVLAFLRTNLTYGTEKPLNSNCAVTTVTVNSVTYWSGGVGVSNQYSQGGGLVFVTWAQPSFQVTGVLLL